LVSRYPPPNIYFVVLGKMVKFFERVANRKN
jgi:hypothetical protein